MQRSIPEESGSNLSAIKIQNPLLQELHYVDNATRHGIVVFV